jgi:rod shape determining protein RodA
LGFLIPIGLLLAIGLFTLISLDYISNAYFIFVGLGILLFLFFSRIDFEVISIFSKFFYIGSIIFLLVPILIGSATRGTIRWIPIGDLTVQPAELVRPFLFVFLAVYLQQGKKTLGRFLKGGILFAIPTFLILIQPSLGVTLMTLFGGLGIYLLSSYPKKYYLYLLVIVAISIPIGWALLADYQRARISTFLDPTSDPQGAGYNSLQAMISVGSGRLSGRGLGRGVQTQLAYLPEKQSDFVFAALSEELGFVGAILVLTITFYLLYKLVKIIENSNDPVGRAFVSGFFLSLFAQIVVHVGMNTGMLPITGVPYPLISAGGSSLLATMAGLGIASSVKNTKKTSFS